jgi:hypothetical protein
MQEHVIDAAKAEVKYHLLAQVGGPLVNQSLDGPIGVVFMQLQRTHHLIQSLTQPYQAIKKTPCQPIIGHVQYMTPTEAGQQLSWDNG